MTSIKKLNYGPAMIVIAAMKLATVLGLAAYSHADGKHEPTLSTHVKFESMLGEPSTIVDLPHVKTKIAHWALFSGGKYDHSLPEDIWSKTGHETTHCRIETTIADSEQLTQPMGTRRIVYLAGDSHADNNGISRVQINLGDVRILCVKRTPNDPVITLEDLNGAFGSYIKFE